MPKLSLPSVTLVCADCVCADRAWHAIERSMDLVDFGDVRLLTSLETPHPHRKIRHLGSINDYSAFCLKDLHQWVDTSHMLTVQHDGWVINPGAWDPAWLSVDYAGPLFQQERHVMPTSVGSGGFSLRSKVLMEAVSGMLPQWDGVGSYDGRPGGNDWSHEDGVVSKHLRHGLQSRGLKFATPDQAARFGYGGNPHRADLGAFGFHGFWPELAPQRVSNETVIEYRDRLRVARGEPKLG